MSWIAALVDAVVVDAVMVIGRNPKCFVEQSGSRRRCWEPRPCDGLRRGGDLCMIACALDPGLQVALELLLPRFGLVMSQRLKNAGNPIFSPPNWLLASQAFYNEVVLGTTLCKLCST